MRLDDRIRKTVVFIGRAKGGPFYPEGTGFMAINFEEEQGFQHIVTAKHVVENIGGNVVHVRLNRKDGTAEVIETARDWWFPHPNPQIDVMICPSRIPTDQFDLMHLDVSGPNALDHIKHPNEIGIGDEVYVPGMFIARVGEVKNLPILRAGVISAMPEEKIKTQYGYHDAYLIEARSIDGLSGSPVFAFTSMIRLQDGKIVPNPTLSFYLIGMLLGHNQVINPSEVIEITQKRSRRRKKTRDAIVPLNTGIGVVLPITAIVDTINQEPLRMKREAILRRVGDRAFKADSVSAKSEPPTKADNPSHKEDFTALVDAAAKKKPRGG